MRRIRKLWDHDAHLMTDEKLTGATEEKTVDFEDGHSVDLGGEDGVDGTVATAIDVHGSGHEEGVLKSLDNIAKTMKKLRKRS